jgi:hypothetical protein
MRNPQAFNCDVCGRAKGQTNHWWIVYLGAGHGNGSSLVVNPWEEVLSREIEAKHACGNACTQKLLERFLSTGSLNSPLSAGGAA